MNKKILKPLISAICENIEQREKTGYMLIYSDGSFFFFFFISVYIDDSSRQNTVLNCSFKCEENAEQGETVSEFYLYVI